MKTVARRTACLALGLAVVGASFIAGRATVTPASVSRPQDSGSDVVLMRPPGAPLIEKAVLDGNLRLRPLSYECGMPAVFGTHAEAEPEGSFCRVWTELTNIGAESHDFDTGQQAVTDLAGRRFAPDPSAMAVRRQAPIVSMGGHQTLWLELWFDVPKKAAIAAVRLSGDADPPAYRASHPARRAPGGVVFRFGP